MRLLDRNAIKDHIPHRDPFLFVDGAIVISAEHIEGQCVWRADNPLLAGHLPGFPLVPGVMMIEGAAQLLAVLLTHNSRAFPEDYSTEGVGGEPIGVLTVVRRAMFHKPVFPEQVIHCSVQIESTLGAMFTASCQGRDANQTRVFRCDLAVAVTDKSMLKHERQAEPQEEQA